MHPRLVAIHEKIDRHGIHLQTLADRSKVSRPTILSWRRDDANPRINNLEAVEAELERMIQENAGKAA